MSARFDDRIIKPFTPNPDRAGRRKHPRQPRSFAQGFSFYFPIAFKRRIHVQSVVYPGRLLCVPTGSSEDNMQATCGVYASGTSQTDKRSISPSLRTQKKSGAWRKSTPVICLRLNSVLSTAIINTFLNENLFPAL